MHALRSHLKATKTRLVCSVSALVASIALCSGRHLATERLAAQLDGSLAMLSQACHHTCMQDKQSRLAMLKLAEQNVNWE